MNRNDFILLVVAANSATDWTTEADNFAARATSFAESLADDMERIGYLETDDDDNDPEDDEIRDSQINHEESYCGQVRSFANSGIGRSCAYTGSLDIRTDGEEVFRSTCIVSDNGYIQRSDGFGGTRVDAEENAALNLLRLMEYNGLKIKGDDNA